MPIQERIETYKHTYKKTRQKLEKCGIDLKKYNCRFKSNKFTKNWYIHTKILRKDDGLGFYFEQQALDPFSMFSILNT